MSIDPKPGDIAHIRVKIGDSHGIQWVGADGKPVSTYRQAVFHVEPRPLKVGDTARMNGTTLGPVRAIADGEAWVRVGLSNYSFKLDILERVDD